MTRAALLQFATSEGMKWFWCIAGSIVALCCFDWLGKKKARTQEASGGIHVAFSGPHIGSKDHFYSKLAGVSYRRAAVKLLRDGERLTLVPQPDNPHDKNAIAVFDHRGNQVGYLNQYRAEYIARQMSAGARYAAEVKEVTGGGMFKDIGVNIRVWLDHWDQVVLEANNRPAPAKPRKKRQRKKTRPGA